VLAVPIEVRPLSGRGDLRRFIYLPARVHRDHPNWIPPIYMDEWRYFDSRRNHAFRNSEAVLALAWRDRRPVGRVMGIIQRRYNEKTGEQTSRFGYLEAAEDRDVVLALLRFVEDWARERGMNRITGPLGFSDQDPEGFMVEGFDEEPLLACYQNRPWMPGFLESAGYSRELDYVHYLVPVPAEPPELYVKISRRLLRQQEYSLLEFTSTRQIKPWIYKVFELMNATYRDIYAYTELERDDMDALAGQYLPVLDPRFVKMVANRKGELVAFIIGMPHMNEGLRRSKGHILPFGYFLIKAAMKRTKQLDLYLGAIRQDSRGKGLDVLMGTAMFRSARAAGFERIDSHHEMETNTQVRAEMERAGGRVFKRFRVFQKTL
jgi:GNAT superfamily N-acetyltransferase